MQKQSGVVLVVSLIMLLLLTMIGISALQNTGLEEKMAGNMRDRNLAFQAAETALRDAERDIGRSLSTDRVYGFTNFSADCGLATATALDDGLCFRTAPFDDTAGNRFLWDASRWPNIQKVDYGAFTSAPAIKDKLSAQPQYVIETFSVQQNGCAHHRGQFCYRITVRAQGANPNTVVWLQTVYKPRI